MCGNYFCRRDRGWGGPSPASSLSGHSPNGYYLRGAVPSFCVHIRHWNRTRYSILPVSKGSGNGIRRCTWRRRCRRIFTGTRSGSLIPSCGPHTYSSSSSPGFSPSLSSASPPAWLGPSSTSPTSSYVFAPPLFPHVPFLVAWVLSSWEFLALFGFPSVVLFWAQIFFMVLVCVLAENGMILIFMRVNVYFQLSQYLLDWIRLKGFFLFLGLVMYTCLYA